ncbi:hypothetical protein ACF0H5_009219 [Mactra antiquata]
MLVYSNDRPRCIHVRNTADIDISQDITLQNSSDVIKIFTAGRSESKDEKITVEARAPKLTNDEDKFASIEDPRHIFETNMILKEMFFERNIDRELESANEKINNDAVVYSSDKSLTDSPRDTLASPHEKPQTEEKFDMQTNTKGIYIKLNRHTDVDNANVEPTLARDSIDHPVESIKRPFDTPRNEAKHEQGLLSTPELIHKNKYANVNSDKLDNIRRGLGNFSDVNKTNTINLSIGKRRQELKLYVKNSATTASKSSEPNKGSKNSKEFNYHKISKVNHSNSQVDKVSVIKATQVKQQPQKSHIKSVEPKPRELSKEEINKRVERIKLARFTFFLRKNRNKELQKFIEHNFDATSGPETGIQLVDDYFSTRKTKVNSHDYRFIFNGHKICNGAKPPWLLVMVLSSASHVKQRAIIRKTWGRVAQGIVWPGTRKAFDSVKIMFIFGKTKNKKDDETLIVEKNQYGDIVQADFVDSYNNLTRKVMMGIKWTTKFCPGVRYLLKVDDDSFVHIPNAARVLKRASVPDKGTVFGNLVKGPVLRQGKWGIARDVYPFANYPEYVSGQTYAISGNILGKLFYVGEYLPYIFIEDAFITGRMSQKNCSVLILDAKIQKQRLKDMKNAARKKKLPITETFSNDVTHVVTEFTDFGAVLRKLNIKDGSDLDGVEILSVQWFTECLRSGSLVKVEDRHKICRQSKVDCSNITKPEQEGSRSELLLAEYGCQRATPLKHWNEKFTNAFEVLEKHADLREGDNDYSRSLAFRRAACVLKSLPFCITRIEQLQNTLNIGDHCKRIIQEIIEDGESSEAQKILNDPWFHKMKLFTSIFGIGPSHSKDFIQNGWSTIKEAQKGYKSEDWRVKWGLSFHSDLTTPVLRSEAMYIQHIVEKHLNRILPGAIMTVTGGFRRGKETGHDVDILISHPVEDKINGVLPRLINSLECSDILLHGRWERCTFTPEVLYRKSKLTQRGQLDHFEKWIGILKVPRKVREQSKTDATQDWKSSVASKAKTHGENTAVNDDSDKTEDMTLGSRLGDEISAKSCDNGSTKQMSSVSNESIKEVHTTDSYEDKVLKAGITVDPYDLCKEDHDWIARRVDLIISPISQYYYALVGWTGSKQFNRDARTYAERKHNMMLTSHGLYDFTKGRSIPASSEKEVFDNLQLPYYDPCNRNC